MYVSNEVITTGTVHCNIARDGFVPKQFYNYEHMHSDVNGMPYFRIFLTETEYQTYYEDEISLYFTLIMA